ncbi:MAG: hypothetical protein JWQ90_2472 [Hydrocarboniphaga sp.]|uniref:FecR family protein n=1 Tax=Hydrocarboniphaga sp. TaxID=2033016 RepID=UPI00263640A8|nr:FecR domain-containing protein [Hydrocarboniphaga sp.]MDB5970022.1 hypothetical protein [Hydrocarboniphaga sp.]
MKSSELPSAIDEQAARCYLRLQDPEVSGPDIEACLDWLEFSHEHQAAYERVEALWKVSAKLPAPPLPQLEMRRGENPAEPVRGRFGWLAVAAALLIAVGIAGGWRYAFEPQAKTLIYTTSVGENRSVALDDGSTVVLSGASTVVVDYSRAERRVTLSDGQALFNVAKDRLRPFIVSAGGGQVRAVGTAFDVRRGLQGVTVTVVDGVVQVDPHSGVDGRRAKRLEAGYQLSYFADGSLGAVMRVPPEQALAWRDGKLIFFDRPLADIVVDLNRYSRRHVVLQGEEIRALRFTGVIMVDRMQDWLRGLEKSSPVVLVESDEALVLRQVAASPGKSRKKK